MKRSYLLIILLASVLIGIYDGCVPSKPGEDIEILPSERLIKKLEANRRKIKSFEGIGNIAVNSSEINANANFKITIQRPDSIYLEIYGPFGIDLAKALVTYGNFTFYDVINNTVYKGQSNSDVLEKIFKVNLSFGELVDAFTGSVNLTPQLSQEPSEYEVSYDKYVLTYIDSLTLSRNRYKVDIRELAITDYQLFSDENKLILEGIYTNFRPMEGVSIPMRAQIVNKAEDQKVSIEYRKVELNKRNTKITMSIPGDAKIVEW